ncbi:MAG: DUF4105 domain-containing protein [Pseudomonadota bacterium]
MAHPRIWWHSVPHTQGEVRAVKKVVFGALGALWGLLMLGFAGWAALAMWFRLPLVDPLRIGLGGLVILLALVAAIGWFTSRWRLTLGCYAVAMAAVLGWWVTLQPAAQADWSPSVARQVTGAIDGDTLRLKDVRAFRWRGENDAEEVWENRTYDLTQLESVDFLMSHWGSPAIGHFMLSFGFADGRHLMWSVEVRRKVGGQFSAVADFFRSNTLVIVAGDERDIAGLRSNIWGNDVYLYRLRARPENIRNMLEAYVQDANALAAEPRFYNSLTSNCFTVVFKLMPAVDVDTPLDWRVLANGYLPEYAHDLGAVDTRLPMAELRALGRINDRALADGLSDDFSAAIRAGVPVPPPLPAN